MRKRSQKNRRRKLEESEDTSAAIMNSTNESDVLPYDAVD